MLSDDASPREGCCSPKTRTEGRCSSTAGGESNHSDHLTQLVKHSDPLRTSRVSFDATANILIYNCTIKIQVLKS